MRSGAVLFLLVALGYAVGSQLAFSWFGADGLSASFFPAAGVTLAALLLVPRRRWPVVLAAAGLAELTVDLYHDLALLPTLGYVAANLTQPLVGALLLGALVSRVDLSRTRDLAALIACAVVAAPAVGGIIGASSFVLLDGGDGWARFAAEWWVGDGLGVLVVAGAILSLWARPAARLTPATVGTALLLGGAAVLATAAVFQLEHFGLVYVPVVLLAILAFRVGTRGVALTGAAMAFVAAEATAEGSRYWDALDIAPQTGLLYLQLALGVVIATALALAAEIAQRERTGLELARAESERAVALDRAKLMGSEQRARVQAESLGRSAAALARTATVDEVADAVVGVLAGWGASGSSFFLVEGEEVVLLAAAGADGGAAVPPDDEARVAEAVRGGTPVVARGDEPAGGSRDTVVALPVVTGDGTVRAALRARAVDQVWLTEDREDLVSTLADQAAVALDRAFLLAREKEARRRAEVLERHAARLAAAATISAVARTTMVDLEAVGVAAAWVQLLRGDMLELVETFGVPAENHARYARYPVEQATPPAEAARQGTVVEVPTGAELDARYPEAAAGRSRLRYESLVSVPLSAAGGRTLGVLTFTSREPHWLDDERRRLISGLAEQCGLALERAQLQVEADAAAEDAALLAELGEVLERAPGTAERSRALVDVLAGSRAALAAVHLLDEPLERPLLSARAGSTEVDDATLGRMAAAAVSGDETVRAEEGGLVLLAVPLRARSRALGVLTTGTRPEDAERLTPVLAARIATRAALALDNALLYEQERDVSHSLQMGLLGGELVVPRTTAIATAYRPGTAMLEVGGDWYDAFTLPSGKLALLVGDVVGHGLEAAVAMGQLRGAVRALAPMGTPRQLLERLDEFVDLLPEAAMATIAYAELDPEDGRIAYACAGHPPPLLVPVAGGPRLLWDGRSPPLGSSFAGAREEAADRLEPGDTIVLYTDGLVERRVDGFSAGLDALVDVAGAEAGSTPSGLVDRILADVLVDESQDDDVCLLALRLATGAFFTHTFPAVPTEVARMRRALTGWLEELELDDERRRDVVLATSEAAANAAEHAYAFDGAGLVEVEAWVRDGELHVSVSDEGTWREPHADTDRGRGRTMMQALMRVVTIDQGPGGTVVRMSVATRNEVPVR